MKFRLFAQLLIFVAAFSFLPCAPTFAQTSASLTGEVQDAQGAALPNAKVTLTEPTKAQTFDTVTSAEGTFSFPTLQPGTYNLTVEAQGFKRLEKTGIILEVADRQSAGTLTLEIGDVSSTVEVSADAAQLTLKTESGEQGDTITGRQVRDLALNGRNYLDLATIIPGVVSEVNGQIAGANGLSNINVNGERGTQNNVTIDGSTNVDTGSNGTQHVGINIDTIQEYKILTSNYQAQYGRSGGGQILVVTKGGGREFHGTGYLFHRHEQFNANTFFNDINTSNGVSSPVPRNLYRYNYFGYNLSGPVKLPKNVLKDKLFFFFGQDFAKQLLPRDLRQVRVPTALEVAGDFSRTTDGNGNQIYIRDPNKPLTTTSRCQATPATTPAPGVNYQGACFSYQGRLNVIDPARINASGQAILKLFNKYENIPSGLPLFNEFSQQSLKAPRREETYRIDYNATANTRIFARFTQDTSQIVNPYGMQFFNSNPANVGPNFPYTPVTFRTPGENASFSMTTTLSATTVNEFTFGPSASRLSFRADDPNFGTMSGLGLSFALPYSYASNQFVNITFAGTPNQTFAVIRSFNAFPYRTNNSTFDFADNLSRVFGTHTVKVGVLLQRSRKDQTVGNSLNISFGNNANNANNTGHAYANALLGIFDNLSEPIRPVYDGQFRYTDADFYLQDNWKVNKRLTLDYGMRFSYLQPQYDRRLQSTFFNPALYDSTRAVRLYRPDLDATGKAAAIDPLNPKAFLASNLVGRIVPNSGDPYNGIGLASNGYLRGGNKSRGLQLGPAFGFAYDITGTGRTIVRGGYRIAYDRVSGNALSFPSAANAPISTTPSYDFGTFDTVAARVGDALSTSTVLGADPTGKIPSVQSFSFQLQQNVGFSTVLSAAYVGSLSRHLPQIRNLNYVPYGATFRKENQDPTKFTNGVVPDFDPTIAQVYRDAGLSFDGSKALPVQLLRPISGYDDINYRENAGSANYHSLQVTAQRRFKQGFTYGVAYTFSKALGTVTGDNNNANPVCSRCYDYRRLDFDRRHILAINYVYRAPSLSARFGLADGSFAKGLVKALFDDYQISGITQFRTGAPVEATYTLQAGTTNVNLGQRINGSYTEAPRLQLTGNPNINNRTRQRQFDYTQLRLPDINSPGLGARNYLTAPGTNVTNLSFFKNVPYLGGQEKGRFIQLRFEFFNIFNHPQFDDFNRALQFTVNSDFSNYRDIQQASPVTVRNTRGGPLPPTAATDRLGRAVGEVNSQPSFVSGNRVIQFAVKMYF